MIGFQTPEYILGIPLMSTAQGCWRALLWKKLQENNVQNTDFVGTLKGQGCGFEYDGENEGHGGLLVTDIARENMLEGWLRETKPDVVMMHLGTNDVWSDKKPDEIVGAFDKLVDNMRESKATMKILVSWHVDRGRVMACTL